MPGEHKETVWLEDSAAAWTQHGNDPRTEHSRTLCWECEIHACSVGLGCNGFTVVCSPLIYTTYQVSFTRGHITYQYLISRT